MKLIAIHEHKKTKQTKKQKFVVGKVKKNHLSFCKLYIMYYLNSSLRSYRNLFEKKIYMKNSSK